jgi:hypothetical protein
MRSRWHAVGYSTFTIAREKPMAGSRKYLPLCVAEFQFRYNNRENSDIFAEAIKGC